MCIIFPLLIFLNLNSVIANNIINFHHGIMNNFCGYHDNGLFFDDKFYMDPGNRTSKYKQSPNKKFPLPDPLFLTPHINSLKIEEARKLSRVGWPFNFYKSYSGFLTVNEAFNSNLFFWFFPCVEPKSDSRLIVWLEGSTMQASSFRVFADTGPYILQHGKLQPRTEKLINKFHVLYIDCPVGVGFSFTSTEKGYSKTSSEVASDLMEALQQFFKLFPEMRHVEMYLTADLYASKFIIALANVIYNTNPQLKVKLRLHGLLIGNGFVDPINMISMSGMLYQLGIVDTYSRITLKQIEDQVIRRIQSKDWLGATRRYRDLMYTLVNYGLNQPYDITKSDISKRNQKIVKFLTLNRIKAAIHVGDIYYKDVQLAYCYLEQDFFKSMYKLIGKIIPTYKFLFYTGQFGLEVNPVKMDSFLRALEWQGAHGFGKMSLMNWKVNHQTVGYRRTCKQLTHVVLIGYSTLDLTDKPNLLLALWDEFIKNPPFGGDSLFEVERDTDVDYGGQDSENGEDDQNYDD